MCPHTTCVLILLYIQVAQLTAEYSPHRASSARSAWCKACTFKKKNIIKFFWGKKKLSASRQHDAGHAHEYIYIYIFKFFSQKYSSPRVSSARCAWCTGMHIYLVVCIYLVVWGHILYAGTQMSSIRHARIQKKNLIFFSFCVAGMQMASTGLPIHKRQTMSSSTSNALKTYTNIFVY